jgi:DNA-binding NtrC family response regulator
MTSTAKLDATRASGEFPAQSSSRALDAVSILLVDDDKLLVHALSRVLVAAGVAVESCADGASAIERIAAGRFDVVVSDIGLPGMSGIELLRAIRDVDDDLPVVLITGAPAKDAATEAVESGALKYLVKPFKSDELLEAVVEASRLYRLVCAKRDALEVTEHASTRFG